MRITSGGDVNIGSTSNVFGARLGVTSSAAFPLAVITPSVAGLVVNKTTDGAGNQILFTSNNSFNYGVTGVISGNGTATGDVFGLGYTPSGGAAFTSTYRWTSFGDTRASIGGYVSINTSTFGTDHPLLVISGTSDYAISAECSHPSNPGGVEVRYTASATNNNGAFFFLASDTSATRCIIKSNGGINNFQGNDSNLSDVREKKNINLAGSYLDKICAIPVKTFNYIDQNQEEDDGLTLGVIAQDVQAVAPELVSESDWGTEDNPKMRLSVYQTDLQFALMKCIQEQQTIINDLKTRIETLESN
jgi:hypothetical protein